MAHIKRLVREVKRYHNEMESDKDEQLIYYFPQENNLEIGYALIIGPDDTPYHNCFYLVKMTYSRTIQMFHQNANIWPLVAFDRVKPMRRNLS